MQWVKSWAQQLAGTVLVVVFVLAVGGFVTILRAQQADLAAAMAAAHIRAVSPPDSATNVPTNGEIRVDYVSQPAHDPVIKLEPPVGVTLDNAHWDGTTFVIDYHGLHDDSLYHVELDQDDWTGKGEHKQVKVHWSFRTGSSMHVAPSSSPTPPVPSISASPPLTPGPSSPLIWYHGPYTSLYGVDWSGKQVKSLISDNVIQSPDGTRLWRRSTVTDSDGNVLGSVAIDQSMMWADDSRQFCGVTSTASGSYELEMLRINGSRDRVGAVTLTPGTPQTPVLAACSVLTRRAVVIGQSSGYTWSVSMISLSDGSVLYQHSYPNPLARIVASHDGEFIAEQYSGNVNGGPAILIRQLPTGTTVGQFSGIVVQGFSWDGSLVIGSTSGNPSIQEAQVYRWRTHETVWHQCTCPQPASLNVLPQPGGSKLAVIASWNHGLNWSVDIVDADGTSQPVPPGNTPLTPAF